MQRSIRRYFVTGSMPAFGAHRFFARAIPLTVLALAAAACGGQGDESEEGDPSSLESAAASAATRGNIVTLANANVGKMACSTNSLGGKYFDARGTARDPLDILKSIGVNYVRLRAWNNPASGYNNKAKILSYAKVVKAKGLALMIDFHYSDTWADPGKQFKPAAWASHGISQLQTDVYNYTFDVCNSLKAQGTTPDSVFAYTFTSGAGRLTGCTSGAGSMRAGPVSAGT